MIDSSDSNALPDVQYGATAVHAADIGEDSVAQRDRAFGSAVTPLIDVAFRIMRRLGVPNRELDDALQTVLLSADRKFDALQDPQELKAYLCAACVSVARDVGRRDRRHTARNSPLDDVPESPAFDVDPEGALGQKERLAMVQQVLGTMDEERRVVFVLYELEELSGQEIATQLGIPPGTVASRLRKAREDFQEGIRRAHVSERNLRGSGR